MKKNFLLLTTTILLAILFFSCTKKKIEGQVFDYFNQPLEGVIVTIANSTFQATTDSKGSYSIDYVPGSINLNYAKQGYTSGNLNLDITHKESFPAQRIVLIKIPTSSEAKDLIIKKEGFPKYRTERIEKEYLQSESVLWGFAKVRGWEGAYLDSGGEELRESLNFYASNRLLSIGKKNIEGINDWSGKLQSWLVYTITPTDEGKKYLIDENTQEYIFKSCDLDFGEITGIQMQEQFKTATANYTIIIKPTPFGNNISQRSENHTAQFSLFEDGWGIF